MSEQTVETKVESAVAQPEVDYEAKLAEKDAELAKVRGEKENYRKGMLKAKGKLPEEEDADDTPPKNWREQAREIAREEYLSTEEGKLQAERDEIIKASARKVKELTIALKNRGQITSNTAQGSNEDKPDIKTDSFFSQDQIQAFKAKGWSDAKIEAAKKNMQRKDSFGASPFTK